MGWSSGPWNRQTFKLKRMQHYHLNAVLNFSVSFYVITDDRPFFKKRMMTSSNGNIFRVTGPLCGEFTGPGEFPRQRPVTRSFDVLFDLRLNKRLSKQPWGWWFETPSWSLWRQRDGISDLYCRANRTLLALICISMHIVLKSEKIIYNSFMKSAFNWCSIVV